MFVDPGVKVNGQYYRDVLLSQQMIPAIKQVAGYTFIFQQDSTPARRARDIIQLLQRERDAWLHWSWPLAAQQSRPESRRLQDLGVMQQWVYESRVNNVDELKQRLHDVWHGVQQDIIDLAVSQWRQRLRACVRAHGKHFELLLWACVTQTWVESQYVRINYCWTLFIKITKKLLTDKSMNFQVQQIPRVRQLHKIGEVGKWNYISMAYSLSNTVPKIITIGRLLFKLSSKT